MSHSEDHILALLANKDFDSCNAEEQSSIVQWMKENPANHTLVTDIQFLAAYREDAEKYRGFSGQDVVIRSRKSRWVTYFLVGFIALVLALYFVFEGFTPKRNGIQIAFLPDQSELHLSKGSSYALEDGFGVSNRNITLKGQAFFDVQSNEALPFKITHDHGVITVLGTSFIVEVADTYTDISVIEGSVHVQAAYDQFRILQEGEGVRQSDSQIIPLERQTAWPGLISATYKDASLKQVLQDLEDNSGIKIKSAHSMINCAFNGTFEQASVLKVLEELQILFHIEYSIEVNTVHVSKPQCIK